MQITGSIDDQLMVTAAHRYCLGRSSYIVGSCIDWLGEHWDQFTDNTQSVILRDTIDAIDAASAGAPWNAKAWKDLALMGIGTLNTESREWLLRAIQHKADEDWRKAIQQPGEGS